MDKKKILKSLGCRETDILDRLDMDAPTVKTLVDLGFVKVKVQGTTLLFHPRHWRLCTEGEKADFRYEGTEFKAMTLVAQRTL